LINDYAHHPAEIRAVIRAARSRFPGRRLLVAFQPHQHQRTLCLLPQFAEVLAEAETSVVADIYGARESAAMQAAVSADDLVQAVRKAGGCCEPGGTVQKLPSRVADLRRGDDLVLVLGAGDIDKALEAILAGL
jgi:UDP-N-acetylmuramate--alanine ligase